MFCPNCGIQIGGEEKYCRSCGMELERVAALVAEHGSPMDSVMRKSAREIELISLRMMTCGVILFLIGALVCVAGKRLFHQNDVTTVGIFLLLFGMIMGVLGIVRGLTTKPRQPAGVQANTQPGLQAPTAEVLPAPAPSVTESTTRIMDTDLSLRSESHRE